MKTTLVLMVLALTVCAGFGQTLPVITASPTNTTVYPGNTATFTVTATGATGYQWLFNGTNITGATSATLQVVNAQSTNCGYYMALVKNATGWVPSQMAYLTLDYTYGFTQPTACGILPFSNTNNLYFAGDLDANGDLGFTLNSGTVQVMAGPELDQMMPVGHIINYGVTGTYMFNNGYYNGPNQLARTVMPGQVIYYGVACALTNGEGYAGVWPSTIMKIVAGTNGLPAPSCYGLKFPGWFILEGVEPYIYPGLPTNQLRVSGELVSFTNTYFAYTDYGVPTAQWRKNGVPTTNGNNSILLSMDETGGIGTCILSFTNLQASDAGVYDLIVYGNEWVVSPKIIVSVQTANGQGVFQSARSEGTNLVGNLLGAAGRNYQMQWSTNLMNWNNLLTVSNVTGTVAFTNGVTPSGSQFYRTVLMP